MLGGGCDPFSLYRMTNLAHWRDDIDDALGGEFDGSLSGLCIMSLSFDLTRNGPGAHLTSNRESINIVNGSNHPNVNGLLSTPSSNKVNSNYISQDSQSNGSNCFKRFKSLNDNHDDERKSTSQSKFIRQVQQIKNNLNQVANGAEADDSQQRPTRADCDSNTPLGARDDTQSPRSPQSYCRPPSRVSSPDGSSRSSNVDVRTASPSQQSCSSISTNSCSSSRSTSPNDIAANGSSDNELAADTEDNQREGKNPIHSSQDGNRINAGQGTNNDKRSQTGDGHQIPIYSVRENLLNSSSLKESSFSTSVITSTASMHFKSLHHPFSLKHQFAASPYHQFSNSSLNHDFYDRYLSHDSHQPLQTPLIGIERTQDLLSLKLPPHGPEDMDSQRFTKEWPFEEPKTDQGKTGNSNTDKLDSCRARNSQTGLKETNSGPDNNNVAQRGFAFNYKSDSNSRREERVDQLEPIDLNVSYNPTNCCENGSKSIFNESMKHFNPDRLQQGSCYDSHSKNSSANQDENHDEIQENQTNTAHQYHAQESSFGIESSKQRFQYVLSAPLSVATKLTEDTMTYLNQGQAYEIKLENTTDVAEAKKGFMCSIINIGFHERHMQQAENELWQQWGQQRPSEKIFSVDMKLSYNVFGVESDGLNKYEFLWDSSKVAGVFIRINSISTEFTPKKHGGEKGVPFKLSIETFSYNSKTHDSYFISAACCQIKVFKPKGAERKIRSDRDKISKRPLSEQDKYHRSCDHTIFKECSLTSLHPMAEGSLCYYRHSHGHFASKQVVSNSHVVQNTSAQSNTTPQHSDDGGDIQNSVNQQTQAADNQPSQDQNRSNSDNDTDSSGGNVSEGLRDYHSLSSRNMVIGLHNKSHQSDYPQRTLSHTQYNRANSDGSDNVADSSYNHQFNQQPQTDLNFNHSSELLQFPQTSAFNQMYHANPVRSLAGINNSQHFGMAYYGHTLPGQIPSHISSSSSYSSPVTNPLTSIAHQSHSNHNFPLPTQQHLVAKGASSIYRQLNPEKPIGMSPAGHGLPFKNSSQINFSSSNNYQTYLPNQQDHCLDVAPNDVKDGNTSYHNDHYDAHLHHNLSTAGAHNQQHNSRQRNSSTSTTTPGTCLSTYNGYNGQHSRTGESYISHSIEPQDGNHPSTHWTHNFTNPTQPLSTKGPTPNPAHANEHQTYNNTNNFESNNQQYDSDHNSPMKSHLNHTSDSSSSCYSRCGDSSSVAPCNNLPIKPIDIDEARINSTLSISSSCADVIAWFTYNRFGQYAKTFSNFSGSDLFRLSRNELIEICGLIDGIRLYNSLHNQPIKPRKVLYVSYKVNDVFHPIHLYNITLKELLKELSNMFISSTRYRSSKRSSQTADESGECHQKTRKQTSNSNSSTDSRSSAGAISSDTAIDEFYTHNDRYFSDTTHTRDKCSPPQLRLDNSVKSSNEITISRLLIEGLASVKIVATERMIQMLEDESMWTLNYNNENEEACLTACQSHRQAK